MHLSFSVCHGQNFASVCSDDVVVEDADPYLCGHAGKRSFNHVGEFIDLWGSIQAVNLIISNEHLGMHLFLVLLRLVWHLRHAAQFHFLTCAYGLS